MNELSWSWIALMATLPLAAGMLLAYPFWRKDQSIFGNIIATGVIFTSAFAMIWREHVEIDRIVQRCLDEGTTCWPEPSAFTRFAIYAFIGLIEVFVVFTLSIRIEDKHRRRGYAPEWR